MVRTSLGKINQRGCAGLFPVRTTRSVLVALVVEVAVWMGACASTPDEQAHLPMYGGMDRQAIPKYRDADLDLMIGSQTAFGSLEKASEVSVDHGFKFVEQKEYTMAMKRFNQAWTLNPDNPRVYWGFGTVLTKKGKPCEAAPLLDKAVGYQAEIPGLDAQTAAAYRACVDSNPGLAPDRKAAYLARARALTP